MDKQNNLSDKAELASTEEQLNLNDEKLDEAKETIASATEKVETVDNDEDTAVVDVEDIDALLAIEEDVFDLDIDTAAGELSNGGSSSAVQFERDGQETIVTTEFNTTSFSLSFAPIEKFSDSNFARPSFSLLDDSASPSPSDSPFSVQLTDNFVNGVSYSTSSGLSGITGDSGVSGELKYMAGDVITLTVGNVIVAEFSADVIQGDILFLQDIAGTELSDNNSQYVENMAIFLQALDSDLTDSTPSDELLQTNQLANTDSSYASNITITEEVRDALSNYIDKTTGEPLLLSTSGKEMLSQVLAELGIEFTRESELDKSGEGNNVFESIAMEHVADTIQDLAGDRTPDSADERIVDTLDVPGALITYHFDDANGVINFTSDDLLVGAVGQQVVTENLVVDNVKLSADFSHIGELVDNGDGQYSVVLFEGITGKDLEGLSIDYRVEDWTVSRDVTSESLDLYKSHLSSDIADVNEGDGYNQFTLNSSLVFDEDSALTINFTSELLSEQLTEQVLSELTALGKEAQFENGVLNIAEYADDYTVPVEYSNDGGETWNTMTVVSLDTSSDIPRPIFGFELATGNQSIEIRIPIFDDVEIEATEYFRAEVSGDNFYDETLIFAIEDNDSTPSQLPTLDIDYVLASEGQSEAVFTVTLSEVSSEIVTVKYSTQELSALFGEDFTAVEGTITFLPGETTATISIPIIDDFIIEDSPEFALVNLSDATNAIITDGQGTLRIFDNDLPVNLSVSDAQINEGDVASFIIDLDKHEDISSFILLNISLSSEQADLSDYDPSSIKAFYGDPSSPQYLAFAQSGHVIIPINVDSITVVVNTLDDGLVESTEQLTLTAKIGDNQASGTVTIVDNDTPPNVGEVTVGNVIDSIVEGTTNNTTVIGIANVTNPDDLSITYVISDTDNYSIDPSTGVITLTDAGVLLVNSGNDLPDFTVEATSPNAISGTSDVVNPADTTDVDDGLTVSVDNVISSITEGTADNNTVIAQASSTNPDNSDITYAISDETNYVIDPVSGQVTLTPAGIALMNTGQDLPDFTVTATSSTGDTGTSGIIDPADTTNVNDGPTLTAANGSLDEDSGSVTVAFTAADVDGTVTTTATVPAEQGTVVVDNENGTYTFTPAENFNGDATITLVTTDDDGATASTISTVTVNDVNDGPTFTAANGSLDEDSGSVTVAFTAADVDGTVTTTATVPAEQGTVVVDNENGTYTFTPAENFNGDATITLVTTDDDGATATTTSIVAVGDV
ncbi:hypothetical protein E2R68_06470, partial [Psychromonas sp. RZ22]|uniref:cadherin-like domain-containing protein n=1 Tax=Psychromonas algarum TaxID=2555643 RepID=UPI0010677EA3